MRISDWSSDVCSSDLLLGLGQGKTTNPVNLLGNHHFTGLKIGNHTQQLGAVGTGTRCLLPIDCRDIIARCLRLGYEDRKSVVKGQSVSVRVDFGVCRIIKQKITKKV